MDPIRITIPLDPRTKKNHQMIAGSGPRCPVCRKHERQFVKQGTAYDEYASSAMWELKKLHIPTVVQPVNVRYRFYMKTRRPVDLTNLTQAADDILVNAGILADDRCTVVCSHDGSRVRYDKENPRTEILIEEATADDGD